MSEPGSKIILVIDDARIVQKSAAAFFEKLNFEVLVAPNGYEGLKIALASRPDLILLDIMMPRLDGLKTLQVLKSNEATKEIPVVVMTAHTDRINILSAAKLGAAAVITKPLSEEILLEKVRGILGDKVLQEAVSGNKSGSEDPFGVKGPEYAEALRPMVEEFLKYVSNLTDELAIAIRNRDIDRIKQITHDIRGTGGSFGYDDATALAVSLYEAVSVGSSDQAALVDWKESEDLLLQLKDRLKE